MEKVSFVHINWLVCKYESCILDIMLLHSSHFGLKSLKSQVRKHSRFKGLKAAALLMVFAEGGALII